jgi:hypothetical protein
MPQVGFELTISVFERARTFNTLSRAATLIDCNCVAVQICGRQET